MRKPGDSPAKSFKSIKVLMATPQHSQNNVGQLGTEARKTGFSSTSAAACVAVGSHDSNL